METNEQELYDMVAFEFKSYYVVWKPGYAIFRYFEKRGLNRTM